MRILKFGGSSLANAERIGNAGSIVSTAAATDQVVVVVSALGGVTDQLEHALSSAAAREDGWRLIAVELAQRHLEVLDAIRGAGAAAASAAIRDQLLDLRRLLRGVELLGDLTPGVRDRVLATGERLSAPLMTSALRAAGLDATTVDGSELLSVRRRAGDPDVDLEATRHRVRVRLGPLLATTVPVVTGFIGSDSKGRTATLGRSGSDLTATVVGAALDANEVEIWSDVDGVLSAPPRLVPEAHTVRRLSYEEAAELAFFGAAVLYRRTLQPLMGREVPVVVRNTMRPNGRFTVVDAARNSGTGACALAALDKVTAFHIPMGCAEPSLTSAMSAAGDDLLASLTASANGDATVIVRARAAERISASLTGTGSMANEDQAVVAIVGHDMAVQPWVVGRAMETLGRRSVPVHAAVSGASPHVACLLVDREQLGQVLGLLHEGLMLGLRAEQSRSKSTARKEETNEEVLHRSDSRQHRHGRSAAPLPTF